MVEDCTYTWFIKFGIALQEMTVHSSVPKPTNIRGHR
jgi:hypothetical protein